MPFIWTDINNGDSASSVRTKLNSLGKQQTITFTPSSVGTWVEVTDNNAVTGLYPYRIIITCQGIDANWVANVIFDETNTDMNLIAPVCQTKDGAVEIYSSSNTAKVKIQAILCTRGGE